MPLDGNNNLKLQLWADEKLIKSPVALDVDHKGRVWATEGDGRNDSVVVLEDTNNDGRADKRTVFVSEKKFKFPMGIAVFDNVIILSHTPTIIKYTDINRNQIFDKGIDKREVLLKGFEGYNHDHSLHAIIGGLDGRYYFSYGNKGANITTKDGKNIISGSYYGTSQNIGKRSSDGHLYIGGVALSMKPNTTDIKVLSQNLRNSHDMSINSFGDVFHADNDDPSHARISWVMPYSNFGYADLNDGSKSWEETAKSWNEKKIKKTRGDARFNEEHWRSSYPGTTPSGYVLGVGAPTGTYFIEDNSLGEEFKGLFLVCETVRKKVLAFEPKLKKSYWEIKKKGELLGLKEKNQQKYFLPTDIVASIDGSLFVSDWHTSNNRRGKGRKGLGAIYRISRSSEKK